MSLTWLTSAVGEQEEGREVLEQLEMWTSSARLAEEKSDLKCT